MPRPYRRIKPKSVAVKAFYFSCKDWLALGKLLGLNQRLMDGRSNAASIKARRKAEAVLTEAIAREITQARRADPNTLGAPEREGLRFAVKGLIGIFRQYYRSDFMNKPLPSHYAVRRRETEFVRSCVLMAKLIASTDGKSRAPSLRWYLEDARLSGTREEALEMIADRVTELSNEKYDWPPETAAE